MICIILAIDRLFEMTRPSAARVLFQGKIMIVWLTIPIVYGLTTFYQVPALYSTKLFAYFFDPFIGTVGLQGMPQVKMINFNQKSRLAFLVLRTNLSLYPQLGCSIPFGRPIYLIIYHSS